jgi:hypothetical protein
MNTEKGINLGIALRRIFEIAEWLDSRAIVLEKSDKETLPKLRAELAELKARLAPAPEEPVSKCDHNPNAHCADCWPIKEPDPSPTDLNQQNKENTPSLNEWRELGPDEVIQDGDECILLYDCDSRWGNCIESVGDKPKDWKELGFRTRRPLPNSPESEGIKKLEEMPLKRELAKQYGNNIVSDEEPSPEWRELGPDEVIQKGDELRWVPDDCGGAYRACTRLPLPKPIEFEGFKKQEEMPLETPLDIDIELIEEVANHPSGQRVDFNTRQLAMRTAHAIRYLRDEIQKLKKATPHANR